MPDLSSILIALALTLVAGLSTGLGGMIAACTGRPDTRVLAFAMGLSAGVMTYISFVELLPEATAGFSALEGNAEAFTLLAFFGGIGLIALIDWLVPEDENPHEMRFPGDAVPADSHRLRRTGTMLALAIGIHNFPEGMATFVSALDGLDVALPIVVAIAIHNIPEGIAVFVPIHHSTGNRRLAFRYTLLSGLAEPVGALAGAAFLLPFWSPASMRCVWRQWPESWSTFLLTSFCREPNATGTTIWPWPGWWSEWLSWAFPCFSSDSRLVNGRFL